MKNEELGDLHKKRVKAARLYKNGVGVMEIVKRCGLSYPSVRKAIHIYQQQGLKGLKPTKQGRKVGEKKLLNEQQVDRIYKILCSDPGKKWRQEDIANLIQTKTGITVSKRTAANYFSYKKKQKPSQTPRSSPRSAARNEILDAWAAICRSIKENSKFTYKQLEEFFGEGDGSGRVWRSWMAGSNKKSGRLASCRNQIIKKATEDGWLLSIHATDKKTVVDQIDIASDIFVTPVDFDIPKMPWHSTLPWAHVAARGLFFDACKYEIHKNPKINLNIHKNTNIHINPASGWKHIKEMYPDYYQAYMLACEKVFNLFDEKATQDSGAGHDKAEIIISRLTLKAELQGFPKWVSTAPSQNGN